METNKELQNSAQKAAFNSNSTYKKTPLLSGIIY